nr:IS21 family transposase [Desulfuromonas thiophila]
MRKIRDVLRLNAAGMGTRQIGRCLCISRDSAKNYIVRANAAKLGWPLPDDMDDKSLEDRLFPKQPDGVQRKRKPEPDFSYIHEQLKRKDATLEALHQEFLQNHPDGVSYPLMCARYRDYKKTLRRYLRKTYTAGEIVFVDYSGQTVPIYDPKTKEVHKAQIFVGVLAASNYTFAEATWSQRIPDWIQSHNNMFTFFGGVPSQVTPDNLKSAVTRPSRGEAQIQETYLDMARHYGTVIIPARVRKPKDKAKAEFGVLLVQRWILFRLRNQQFTSLGELNQAIKTLLVDLNNRPFQKLERRRFSWTLIWGNVPVSKEIDNDQTEPERNRHRTVGRGAALECRPQA